jgi:hypothetical protein
VEKNEGTADTIPEPKTDLQSLAGCQEQEQEPEQAKGTWGCLAKGDKT